MNQFKVVGTAVTFGQYHQEPVNRLKEIGCDVILNPFGRPFTTAEFKAIAGDADAVIVGNDKVNEEVIRNFSRIKLIAKHGVGIDGIDIKIAQELGIIVTNAPGSNKYEVADSAMAFMLLMARDLAKMSGETKEGKWIKYPTHSMVGKTVGIIGAGNIGMEFARRSRGFDMNIIAFDPVPREEAALLGVKYVDFEVVVRESDYISIHCPLNESTFKMFGAEELKKMKKGVFIVNTARSQIFDYDALYEAMKSGKIGGYSTDVYDYEPPAMHPLYELDNVFLSPHVAGTTFDSNYRMGSMAVDNVIAVLKGEMPPNIILCSLM